jgi:tetratricopeptide (TPR) repeat protein
MAYCDSQPNLPAEAHVALLLMTAQAFSLNDPPEAIRLELRGIVLSRGLGPAGQESLMSSLNELGDFYLFHMRDVDQALAPLAEAEAIFNNLGPATRFTAWEYLFSAARQANRQAEIARLQGHYPQAMAQGQESLRLYEADNDYWMAWHPLISLGETCLGLGEWDAARAHFLAALDLREDPPTGIAHMDRAFTLRCLSLAEVRAGQLAQARDYGQTALRLAAQLPDYNILASCLGVAALITVAEAGPAARAAKLAGASAALWARQKRKPWEDSSLDTLLPGWRDWPDAAALTAAYEAGQTMSADRAIEFALADPTEPK